MNEDEYYNMIIAFCNKTGCKLDVALQIYLIKSIDDLNSSLWGAITNK